LPPDKRSQDCGNCVRYGKVLLATKRLSTTRCVSVDMFFRNTIPPKFAEMALGMTKY